MTDPQTTGTDSSQDGIDPALFTESNPSQSHPAGDDALKIAALEQKVKDLEVQLAKLSDLAARAQADLQNAKARMEKDAKDMRQFAAESILLKLLPTIDNFQRAFQHLPDDLQSHDWVKGVQAVEQDLLRQVGDLGLKKFDSLGQSVDPHRHDVLMTGEGREGEVIEVFEDGYELHGKVIRPAKVKAGQGSLNV